MLVLLSYSIPFESTDSLTAQNHSLAQRLSTSDRVSEQEAWYIAPLEIECATFGWSFNKGNLNGCEALNYIFLDRKFPSVIKKLGEIMHFDTISYFPHFEDNWIFLTFHLISF